MNKNKLYFTILIFLLILSGCNNDKRNSSYNMADNNCDIEANDKISLLYQHMSQN